MSDIIVNHRMNGWISIEVPPSHSAAFIGLVNRAAGMWPDAHPAIKEFADKVTNDGKIMQDYYGQANLPRTYRKITCDNCFRKGVHGSDGTVCQVCRGTGQVDDPWEIRQPYPSSP